MKNYYQDHYFNLKKQHKKRGIGQIKLEYVYKKGEMYEYKPGMVYNKHFLFIIDNPALINNHPIREFLEKPEETLGFSMIQVAKTSNELPKHIKTTR